MYWLVRSIESHLVSMTTLRVKVGSVETPHCGEQLDTVASVCDAHWPLSPLPHTRTDG